MTDPAKAAFVQKEHRYTKAENLTVLATYPNAREITFDTQMNAANAATLAGNLLADLSTPSNAFEVEIRGIITLDDFAAGMPRYLATFPEFNVSAKTFKIVSCEVDYLNQKTTVVIKS